VEGTKNEKEADIMQTYKLTREIPVEEGYDVVVAGGGPAGATAAICAGRLGAKVLLIESTGCLGGMGTSGLVAAFDPMANGERQLVKGLMSEIVETLYSRGFLQPGIDPNTWRKDYHRWTPFNPEGLKLVLDELVTDAGVEVRFFTSLIDADANKETGKIDGVIIHNIEGHRYIQSKTFIDGTGDAVLADLCGVQCREAGRDTPKIMPSTLASLFAGIDWDQAIKKVEYETFCTPMGDQERYPKAIADGYFSQPEPFLAGMSRLDNTLSFLNGGHLFNLNALRCRDLSEGMMLGRRIAHEFLKFYRDRVPGCEKIEHVTTATLMGVRESRRIVGEHELTIDDFLARRQFPDQIGLFNKFIDIHPYDSSDEEWNRFQRETRETGRLGIGESLGITYGILVPKGWHNLWVAGRCASSDVKVHGSIRVMPAASMMGQAAGTAAVQSIKTGQPACDLDTALLVETLRRAGAYLPQEKLSSTMTR
jgi:hypothetical protein